MFEILKYRTIRQYPQKFITHSPHNFFLEEHLGYTLTSRHHLGEKLRKSTLRSVVKLDPVHYY